MLDVGFLAASLAVFYDTMPARIGAAHAANVPLPTVAAAREIYRLAIGQGLDGPDFAALRPKGD